MTKPTDDSKLENGVNQAWLALLSTQIEEESESQVFQGESYTSKIVMEARP